MSDPEINAMSALNTALADLDEDVRGRVLRWAAERYGVNLKSSAGGRHGSGAADGTGGAAGGGITEEDVAEEPHVYEHFADLFAKAQPKTEVDKALVAAYWLQAIEGHTTWQSAALTKELKNLGHAIGNITDALSKNMNKKPQRIVQLQKSGSAKQARKTYKVTHAGLTVVQEMLSGQGE